MIKSIASAVLYIYPNLTPTVDFRVIDDGNGQEIVDWKSSEPIPTSAQLDAAWLEVLKKAKKADINVACNNAILAGFPSYVLGTIHSYPADEEAQRNWNTSMNRFLSDSTRTSDTFKTFDAGYLSHTKAQFFEVFANGHDFGRAMISRYYNILSTITNAQNEADLDPIVWNDGVAPAVPSGLTATGGTGQVALAWTFGTDVDLNGYNVYQGTTKIASLVKTNSFTVTGLTAGSYNFTVSAVDIDGNESAQCTAVSGTAS